MGYGHTEVLLTGGFLSQISGGEGESDLHPVVLHLSNDQDGRPPNLRTHVVHYLTRQLLPIVRGGGGGGGRNREEMASQSRLNGT